MKSMRVYFANKRTGIGGPTSFQNRIIEKFKRSEIEVLFRGDEIKGGSVLIISSTKHIFWIILCKIKGLKIVQRLDGILWRHKVEKQPVFVKLKHYIINYLMLFIRNYLADHVIYQSDFIKQWWHVEYGESPSFESVIYNGVDLNRFSSGNVSRQKKMLCVEGTLQSDYVTINLLIHVHNLLFSQHFIEETVICGNVDDQLITRLSKIKGIRYLGVVPETEMSKIYKSSDLYLSLEINPPCPNAVIEALASGLPVIGYDTGSLGDIINPNGGILFKYNGDPFKLDWYDALDIDKTINIFILNYKKYVFNARKIATQRFNIDDMAKKYKDVLFNYSQL
jgi:glycosyltransferase involved in cell wall biosynthesis